MYNSTGGYGGLSGLPTQVLGSNAAGTLPPDPGMGSSSMSPMGGGGTMGVASGPMPAVMPGAGPAMGGNSAMGLVSPMQGGAVAPPAPLSPDMAAIANALIGGGLQGRASPAGQGGVMGAPNAMKGLFGLASPAGLGGMGAQGGWG